MDTEQIYTNICIEIASGTVVNRYRGNQELTNKHPDLYEWIEWNKPLPEDIDSVQYKYVDCDLERI